IVVVRLVVRDDVGPAVVAGAARLVELVVPARAAVGIVGVGVGAYFAPVKPAGLGVDRDAEGVAVAHGVDFRAPLAGRRADGEEVAGGNGVGAVGLRHDAQDLAAEVVGIAGRALGVVLFPAGALVDRIKAVGLERVGVVAGG